MDEEKQTSHHIWPPGLVEQLVATINHSLPTHTASGEPLVIGIFGEWGSGKSALLAEVARRIEQQAKEDFAEARFEKLIIPIRFNPWRYEKDEHVIVPMLKSARAQLQYWEKEVYYPGKDFAFFRSNWIEKKGANLLDAATAIASGLKLKGKFVELDMSKVTAAHKKSKEGDLDRYQAIYYDLANHIQRLTEVQADGKNLTLVFFIDDLDRCLPDKAVEMLESIKLFFDVQGCAFMLAVDDEVVERGIAHRYKDYRKEGNGELPISGHEYLEKIIQLPIRLPILRDHEVQHLLIKRFPKLFTPCASPLINKELDDGARMPSEGKLESAEYRYALLQLLKRAVPPIPRKLIRSAELIQFSLDLAESEGWRDCDPLTTARLVLLQLFAPTLYRLARSRSGLGLLKQMEQWSSREGHYWWTMEGLQEVARADIDKRKQAHGEGSAEHLRELRNHERLYRPMVRYILDAVQQRGGFDPRELVDADYPSEHLAPYLALAAQAEGLGEAVQPRPQHGQASRSGQSSKRATGLDLGEIDMVADLTGTAYSLRGGDAAVEPPVWGFTHGGATDLWRLIPAGGDDDCEELIRPAKPIEFLDQLFGASPAQWHAAIEGEEGLGWAALDRASFEQLLPELKSGEARPDSWWELVLPILSRRQRGEIEQYLRLTARLLDDMVGESENLDERAAAGRALAHLGDPRTGVGCVQSASGEVLPAPAWVYVPGTEEVAESERWPDFDGFWPGDERWGLDQPANIPPLWVAAYPVTWAQFSPFVEAGNKGYTHDVYWTQVGLAERGDRTEPWLWNHHQWHVPNHPVAGVTWFEAIAWCRWADAELHAAGHLPEGYELRLLTELEWEWAARGPEALRWPWGDNPDEGHCNSKELGLERTSAVGAFPSGAADWMQGMLPNEGLNSFPSLEVVPDTLLDLAGNVWEWCATPWHDTLQPPVATPWTEESLEGVENRVLRGGAFWTDEDSCRGAQRLRNHPDDQYRYWGFRCCVAPCSK